jgi:hypothetical protein
MSYMPSPGGFPFALRTIFSGIQSSPSDQVGGRFSRNHARFPATCSHPRHPLWLKSKKSNKYCLAFSGSAIVRRTRGHHAIPSSTRKRIFCSYLCCDDCRTVLAKICRGTSRRISYAYGQQRPRRHYCEARRREARNVLAFAKRTRVSPLQQRDNFLRGMIPCTKSAFLAARS